MNIQAESFCTRVYIADAVVVINVATINLKLP